MPVNQSSGGETSRGEPFQLPPEIASVLPLDPFEQLDIARKITSIALSSRISALESETSELREKLAEKDDAVAYLTSQLETVDNSFADVCGKLASAIAEKESLMKENATLSESVKKLQRDVSKLEIFRKTLMQSLKEDDERQGPPQSIVAKPSPEEDDNPPTPKFSSWDASNSLSEDRETEGLTRPKPLKTSSAAASNTITPRMTPPGSPRRFSGSLTPTTASTLLSSIQQNPPQTGRTRVDGKEFFRQVRSRLSYEQFSAFLANVKELNAQKQSKEETLKKANEIFGAGNNDLYIIFEGLISRNLQ